MELSYTKPKTPQWYGVTVTVGTYGAIGSGGQTTISGLVAGESYTLYDAYGSTSKVYTATETKVSTFVSDTFGFMARENNSTILVEQGTVITTGWTSLLVKAGCEASFSITSGSVVSSGNGILLQVLDNDEFTVGLSNAVKGIFNTFFSEESGWPTPTPYGSQNKTSLTLDYVTITGDIYNGAGYYGQSAPSLEVVLGNGATLNAAIAATATIHVTSKQVKIGSLTRTHTSPSANTFT
ncbi:hypothetical protein Pelo_19429 [Pelomyxa schiedti]|nr:hypothetical protein Pelo_19429 [Pelomyxa schiedti]